MTRRPRVLIAVRLSIDTDSTTSPERQLEECMAFCERRGWDVVGVAKDLDISATRYAPWQRPELAAWLDRAPEFDNIVFWRLDRFVRKVGDLHTMIEWAENHGSKGLVSATEPFDLTDPFGEVMATMIAAFARMEARAVSERVTSMRQHLLTSDRWGGGSPPYGYTTEERNGGRYLVPNPVTLPNLREIVMRVLNGEPLNAICRDLDERNVPSPSATYKTSKRETVAPWYPKTLKGILTSPTLLGFKTRNEPIPGKKYSRTVLVYDEKGHRIKMAEPLVTEEEWKQLQKALIETAAPASGVRGPEPKTPFLDVIKCGSCGKNLQWHTTKKKRKDETYRETHKIRCLSRPKSPACPGYVFDPETEIIGPVMRSLLEELGNEPVVQRIYVEGDGTAAKLEELEESINYHMAQITPGGIYSKGILRDKAAKTLEGLNEEYERLSSLGAAGESRWEYRELGMTFGERWFEKGTPQITDDLVKAGITMECHPRDKGGHILKVPDDLKHRFAKIMA
ncbi:recombinase family protein [Streptomyces sp. ISL-87]|nr:recombinase family protein [Streptomyces sp. ISL-87]